MGPEGLEKAPGLTGFPGPGMGFPGPLGPPGRETGLQTVWMGMDVTSRGMEREGHGALVHDQKRRCAL